MTSIYHPGRSGAALTVGPLEGEILDVLWRHGPLLGVPDVHRILNEEGRTLSYSAVKAVLNNLHVKGWLSKEKRGKVTHFQPVHSRGEFDALIVRNVVGSLKRNFGAPVIAQFVDQLAVDERSIEEFERLIAKRKAELSK